MNNKEITEVDNIANEDDLDEKEFVECDKCDGHPACEDFGCAYELGLGRMVKKDIQPGAGNY